MMLVRSSSTPILGSLLSSSFNDSPSNNIHHHHSEASSHHALKNHLTPTCVPHQHHHYHKLSCSSSPISPSIGDLERQNKGFRRAQSEGNLEELAFSSFKDDRSSHYMDTPTRFSSRHKYLALETIPSFSISSHKGGLREEEEDEEEEEEGYDFEDEGEEMMREMERRVAVGRGMVLSEEEVNVNGAGVCRLSFDDVVGANKEMYLARGLGIDDYGGYRGGGGGGGGGRGGGDYSSMSPGGNDGNRHEVEEYYKKMVEENPGNPLFLRNYAQFLYQCKQDPKGAEEYYSRAILADPKDGEVLSQYGKLVWELHHDEERATNYFERAVQASPEDSHVHAAYASFLWDTEEGEDGCEDQQCLPPQFHHGTLATAGA